MKSTRFINSWDLVDLSAHHIVGHYLSDKPKEPLYRLAKSESLWERRIAIIATAYFIKRREFAETLKISKVLLADSEDLIHKAVGWMLREVGNRAKACVGCHIGAPAEGDWPLRDMNHDMIAGGHPRLQFDLRLFLEAMPEHWYEKNTGKPRSTFAGHGWDAFQLARLALAKVRPGASVAAERAALRDSLEAIKNFPGTGGIFNMSPEDHVGLDDRAMVLIRIVRGNWEYYGPEKW